MKKNIDKEEMIKDMNNLIDRIEFLEKNTLDMAKSLYEACIRLTKEELKCKKLNKALEKACDHISKYEEPLCKLKECNDQYESCRQCEHSVYTKEEWKEWCMK